MFFLLVSLAIIQMHSVVRMHIVLLTTHHALSLRPTPETTAPHLLLQDNPHLMYI